MSQLLTNRHSRIILVVALLATLLAMPVTAQAAEGAGAVRTEASTASVMGEVFMDANLNGIREPFEVGVSNARVQLTDDLGNVVGSAFTDQDGYYLINDLSYGSFRAEVSVEGGMVIQSNGSFEVSTAAVQAPVLFSTGVAHGLYIPMVGNG